MHNEKIVAKGRIFELVQALQPDGRIFEVARRAPGVRLIIADKDAQKVLLTRERRRELNTYDFRLPGGKVFDTLDQYEAHRKSGGDIVLAAKVQAITEAREEAGIDISDLKLIQKSVLGTTVEWDLYIFEAITWQKHEDGQSLKENEVQDIASADSYDYQTVKDMILGGKMKEERVALILLQWINRQEQEAKHEV